MTLTPKQKAEIARLARKGRTQHQIAAAVGCSQRTVGRALKAAGVPHRRRSDGRTRRANGKGEPSPAVLEGETLAVLVAIRGAVERLEQHGQHDGVRVLGELAEMLGEARTMRLQAAASMVPTAWATIARGQLELLRGALAMVPPPPPDPSADPANLESRSRVRAELERLAATKLARLCSDCAKVVSQ